MALTSENALDAVTFLDLVKEQVDTNFVIEQWPEKFEALDKLRPKLLSYQAMGEDIEGMIENPGYYQRAIPALGQSFGVGLNDDGNLVRRDTEPLFKVAYNLQTKSDPALRKYAIRYAAGAITKEAFSKEVARQLIRSMSSVATAALKADKSRALREARAGKIAPEFVSHLLTEAVVEDANRYYWSGSDQRDTQWMIKHVPEWWRHLADSDVRRLYHLYEGYRDQIPEVEWPVIESAYFERFLEDLSLVGNRNGLAVTIASGIGRIRAMGPGVVDHARLSGTFDAVIKKIYDRKDWFVASTSGIDPAGERSIEIIRDVDAGRDITRIYDLTKYRAPIVCTRELDFEVKQPGQRVYAVYGYGFDFKGTLSKRHIVAVESLIKSLAVDPDFDFIVDIWVSDTHDLTEELLLAEINRIYDDVVKHWSGFTDKPLDESMVNKHREKTLALAKFSKGGEFKWFKLKSIYE